VLEYLPKRRRVGGLRVDPQKADSTNQNIAKEFIPSELIVPVETHQGQVPDILVQVGQQVLRGETIAAGDPDSGVVDIHASSSGRVREIGTIETYGANGAQSLRCITIDTDGADTAVDDFTSGNRSKDLDTRDARLERIRRAGIVGLGGASVSTSWKLTRRNSVPTLIINGAECEPYISCDDMLMREYAGDILAGSLELCELIEAEQCIIAIERDKPRAISAMRSAASQSEDSRLHLAELPSIYPAGGERQLIELLMDTEVPTGMFPADIGIVCQNVGTAYAVHQALSRGEPLIRRVVTLAGRGVARPQNVFARIGTRLSDLIAHFGGYGRDPAALIIGGSMMGIAQVSDAVPVSKATNCVLVPDHNEFASAKREWPCIRCGECAGACPARLLPQELLRATENGNVTTLESLGLRDCIECGCCDAICPSHIALTQRFIDAKQTLRLRHETQAFAERSQHRFDLRAQRLSAQHAAEQESQQALRARLATDEDKKRSIAAALERAKRRSSNHGEES
jgi:electron transport complex protein RnfC